MYIESVKMLKTIKAGKKIFLEGAVMKPPLPKEILDEIIYNTGTVHVVGLPAKLTRQQVYDMVSTPEMKTPDLRAKQLLIETQTQGSTQVVNPEPLPPALKPKKLLVQRTKRSSKKK
jgi:hypothetical protein